MGNRPRRAGSTETFSISVDPETKAALRALADSEFDGNLSALITDLADEARRRKAAGDFLKRLGVPKLTRDEAQKLEQELNREIKKLSGSRRRRVA